MSQKVEFQALNARIVKDEFLRPAGCGYKIPTGGEELAQRRADMSRSTDDQGRRPAILSGGR